jgi:hypothetical protein
MAHLAAKLVSAISAGLVVSVPFATIPLRTVEAAEECLTRPGEPAPPGQHWYYAIDHVSKRRCWHLQPETSSHASMSRRARRAAIVASHKSEPALSRTTADAYAEFGLPQGRDETAPQVSQQTLIASDYPNGAGQGQPDTVSGESPPSLVASRWPEPGSVHSADSEPPPASSFVIATVTPDAKPDAGTAEVTAKAPAVAPTSAQTATTGTPASLEALLLATFGAITLTGFAGSSVYLLTRMRRQPQVQAGLLRGPGLPPTEWVDRTRPPPWLYRDHAHEAGASSLDRLTSGLDEMG